MSIACWRGRSTWTCSGPVLRPGFPSKDPAPPFLSFPEEPQGNTKSPLACLLQTAPVSCQFCSLTSPHSPVSWLVSFFCSFSPPDHLHSQRLPDQDTFLTKHHCLPIGCKSRSHNCGHTTDIPSSHSSLSLGSGLLIGLSYLQFPLPGSSPALLILRDPP